MKKSDYRVLLYLLKKANTKQTSKQKTPNPNQTKTLTALKALLPVDIHVMMTPSGKAMQMYHT